MSVMSVTEQIAALASEDEAERQRLADDGAIETCIEALSSHATSGVQASLGRSETCMHTHMEHTAHARQRVG